MRDVQYGKTSRHFGRIDFKDANGEPCNIQKSSLATEDAIWLGLNQPKVIAAVDGYVRTSRMHLTLDDARRLIGVLQVFVATGELPEAPVESGKKRLTFQEFSALNRERCENGFGHDLSDWSPSDWMVATMGELGEAANVLKKLNRERDGIKGNKDTADVLRQKLARERGDTFIYLDLACQALGVDLGSVVIEVFDAKSREIGYPLLIEGAAAS